MILKQVCTEFSPPQNFIADNSESVKNISIKICVVSVENSCWRPCVRREVGERARSELDDVRERESVAKTSVLQVRT